MFVHSNIVRRRVLAVVLLLPTIYLGWIALQAMATTNFLGFLALVPAIIMLWACWALWKYADYPGGKKALPDPSTWSGPNVIDRKVRLGNVFASCILLVYGIYSLVIDDFFLPAKSGDGTHFSGIGVWLMFASVCCVVVKLISEVIDHYDRRNNELAYANVAAISDWFAWTFFGAALLHLWLELG